MFLLNFLSQSRARHPEAFYFYFPVIIGGMLPWSFFLPSAIVSLLRNHLKTPSPAGIFLVTWFMVIFCFFSIARSKLPTYILPVLPALAILAGSFWSYCIHGQHRQKEEQHCIYSCVFLSSALCAGLVAGFIIINKRYPVYLTIGLPLIIILMASALLIAFAALKKKLLFAYTVLSAVMLISIVYSIQWVLPKITPCPHQAYRSRAHMSLTNFALNGFRCMYLTSS